MSADCGASCPPVLEVCCDYWIYRAMHRTKEFMCVAVLCGFVLPLLWQACGGGDGGAGVSRCNRQSRIPLTNRAPPAVCFLPPPCLVAGVTWHHRLVFRLSRQRNLLTVNVRQSKCRQVRCGIFMNISTYSQILHTLLWERTGELITKLATFDKCRAHVILIILLV